MESRLDPPLPTGDYGSSAHNGAKSPPQIGPGYWKAESTAKANYFNFPIVLGVGYSAGRPPLPAAFNITRRHAAATLMTPDEARRTAAKFAKLLELVPRPTDAF
jgi:hypothetical protein